MELFWLGIGLIIGVMMVKPIIKHSEYRKKLAKYNLADRD